MATQISGDRRLTRFNGFTILLIGFVWIFETSAVAPILGSLGKEFPEASAFQLELVSTIVFVTSVIFSAVSGALAKRFDKRKLIIFGLVIYGITGMMPFFADSLIEIWILRLLTGVGVGLVLPLPNVMIADCYTGRKREKMLGWITSVANVANVINSIVIGLILQLGWRYCFLSFFVVLVIAAVSCLGLPSSPPRPEQRAGNAESSPREAAFRTLPETVWALCAAMVMIWALFQVNILNTSFVVLDELELDAWLVGIAIALPGFASIISGVTFPYVHRLCGTFTVSAALLIFTLGFVVLINMDSYQTLVVGDLIFGYGQGLLVPLVLYVTASTTAPELRNSAYGAVSGCIHLGILMAPVVQLLIALATGSHSLDVFYTIASIGLGVTCAVTAAASLINRARSRDTSAVHAEATCETSLGEIDDSHAPAELEEI